MGANAPTKNIDPRAITAGIIDDFFSTGITVGSAFFSTCLGLADTSILGGGYVIEPSLITVSYTHLTLPTTVFV